MALFPLLSETDLRERQASASVKLMNTVFPGVKNPAAAGLVTVISIFPLGVYWDHDSFPGPLVTASS